LAGRLAVDTAVVENERVKIADVVLKDRDEEAAKVISLFVDGQGGN